ncbi:MAG: L,D-transpeptidase family protein [Patulibacter sp.]|nr:L,D-transpeptidase family protein [Patulibacter sp.]
MVWSTLIGTTATPSADAAHSAHVAAASSTHAASSAHAATPRAQVSASALDATAAAPSAITPAAATPPPTTPAATTPATTSGDPTDSDSTDEGIVPTAATRAVSYAARLVVPVTVRAKPSRSARRITSLKPFGSWNGGPVVLQIAQVKMVGTVRWLRVRLPIRPNGATGWLPQSAVEVRKLRYRVIISRAAHSLTVLKDGKRVASTKVVVGAPGTPTPRGSFAVLEVVRQPKGEDIGPWALHLTAHSDVLENFGGGPGRVAIHGRSGDLLKDPLGTSRSHGCIRASNAFITYLHTVAVEGTPVEIR